MKNWIPWLVILTGLIWFININSVIKEGQASSNNFAPFPTPSPQLEIKEPSNQILLHPQKFVYQTFNNCGPATLSMLLDFYGIQTTQQEIADKLRPFQQAQGMGDDKSVSLDELASYSNEKNLITFKRPNGDINKLKSFLANGIPVLAITWLDKEGGFGHYKIVKGFDDQNNQITEDDSIFGLNKKLSYSDFLKEWQYFNYQYLIVVPPEQKDLVQTILKEELNPQVAYQNALARAKMDSQKNPQNQLGLYNQSTSNYYLGNFKESIKDFEQGQKSFPFRMLWYQYEPILSYQKLKNYNKVFELINFIFQNGDVASSELYFIRGQVYLDQGKKNEARQEFQQAVHYNKNYSPAQTTLLAL